MERAGRRGKSYAWASALGAGLTAAGEVYDREYQKKMEKLKLDRLTDLENRKLGEQQRSNQAREGIMNEQLGISREQAQSADAERKAAAADRIANRSDSFITHNIPATLKRHLGGGEAGALRAAAVSKVMENWYPEMTAEELTAQLEAVNSMFPEGSTKISADDLDAVLGDLRTQAKHMKLDFTDEDFSAILSAHMSPVGTGGTETDPLMTPNSADGSSGGTGEPDQRFSQTLSNFVTGQGSSDWVGDAGSAALGPWYEAVDEDVQKLKKGGLMGLGNMLINRDGGSSLMRKPWELIFKPYTDMIPWDRMWDGPETDGQMAEPASRNRYNQRNRGG